MKSVISGCVYDEERALYNLQDAEVRDCIFAGPADGESALKEARNIEVRNCRFSLRYPLWHVHTFTVERCSMDEMTRAALWYASDGRITDSALDGIKCLRECDRITLSGVTAHSPEFGWRCRGLRISDSAVDSQYFLFESRDIAIDRLHMTGKYSFQYVENAIIRDSVLDTKDAFWHSRHVTVYDSEVKGEYLGWYSENLTLVRCRISGTQPLCYCKDLKLIDCTMEGTDLAFEYSDVQAELHGTVDSVKNPRSGRITADAVGEIIRDHSVMEDTCEICIRSPQPDSAT